MENYDEGERLIHIHKRDKKLLQEASDIKGKLLVLTSREREIALLCGSGLVNKEIAELVEIIKIIIAFFVSSDS